MAAEKDIKEFEEAMSICKEGRDAQQREGFQRLFDDFTCIQKRVQGFG
jgi:hypothetical protein